MIKVVLNGSKYDYDAVVNMMDDEIREELHNDYVEGKINNEQEFVDRYVEEHYKKYNEDFQI